MPYVLIFVGPDTAPARRLVATWQAAQAMHKRLLGHALCGEWSIYVHRADGRMAPLAPPFGTIEFPDSLADLAPGNFYVLLADASDSAAVGEAAVEAGCTAGAALGFAP